MIEDSGGLFWGNICFSNWSAESGPRASDAGGVGCRRFRCNRRSMRRAAARVGGTWPLRHSVLRVATKLSARALSQGLAVRLMLRVTPQAAVRWRKASAASWTPRALARPLPAPAFPLRLLGGGAGPAAAAGAARPARRWSWSARRAGQKRQWWATPRRVQPSRVKAG